MAKKGNVFILGSIAWFTSHRRTTCTCTKVSSFGQNDDEELLLRPNCQYLIIVSVNE